jgi:hypothetical protein
MATIAARDIEAKISFPHHFVTFKAKNYRRRRTPAAKPPCLLMKPASRVN